jgi:diguanylate cyclase (GGDEF)-like protein
MKRFDRLKTIQMVILIVLTCIALFTIIRDVDLYRLIASDPHVRRICIILWIALGISFVFLFYDFNSYANLKRENMELDHAIYSDALTGIANRYSVDVYLGQFLNKPLPKDMGAITLDLTNLGEINSRLGHVGGDAAIQAFSEILQNAASGACFIGRNGGNKFVAIMQDCSQNRIDKFLEGIERQVAERNQSHADMQIKYCYGVAFEEGDEAKTLTELVALSDRRAWKNMHESA